MPLNRVCSRTPSTPPNAWMKAQGRRLTGTAGASQASTISMVSMVKTMQTKSRSNARAPHLDDIGAVIVEVPKLSVVALMSPPEGVDARLREVHSCGRCLFAGVAAPP